jgi:hypothetical protein
MAHTFWISSSGIALEGCSRARLEGAFNLWADRGRGPRRAFIRKISKLKTKSPLQHLISKIEKLNTKSRSLRNMVRSDEQGGREVNISGQLGNPLPHDPPRYALGRGLINAQPKLD